LEVDGVDAASRLLMNMPRLTTETLTAWGATLLLTQPSDIKSFLLYLPNPVPIPGPPIVITTPSAVRIRRERIPVRAVFGGTDIGRLAGAGLEARRLSGKCAAVFHPTGPRCQVWTMDFGPLVLAANPAGLFWRYGPIQYGWTDFPYQFRVLRAPR